MTARTAAHAGPGAPLLRKLFLLKEGLVYLNHGAYGACPLEVLRAWQSWQLEIERDPAEFFTYRHGKLMRRARAALAELLNCDSGNIVYVSNTTTGLNTAIRSLPLQRGEEILASDQEYGALENVWRYVCERSGARYRRHHIRFPAASPAEVAGEFVSSITPQTRVIFISHVAAPTGLVLPIKEIIDVARSKGILTIVDGAHAPGHIPVNLRDLDPDIYAGSAHKWLCAPKGSAFLYVKKSLQSSIIPGVIGWGWQGRTRGVSQLVEENQWQGTRDAAAFLSTVDAIEFQKTHDWKSVRTRCHSRLALLQSEITERTGVRPICLSDKWYGQMLGLRLPGYDVFKVAARLRKEYRIEVQPVCCGEVPLIRVCVQGYNTEEELSAFTLALQKIAGPAFTII